MHVQASQPLGLTVWPMRLALPCSAPKPWVPTRSAYGAEARAGIPSLIGKVRYAVQFQRVATTQDSHFSAGVWYCKVFPGRSLRGCRCANAVAPSALWAHAARLLCLRPSMCGGAWTSCRTHSQAGEGSASSPSSMISAGNVLHVFRIHLYLVRGSRVNWTQSFRCAECRRQLSATPGQK